MPMPAAMPSADPTRPITSASVMTEVSTCRRLAPTARNSASSLPRWATMIENVLKMMNAPTNSAMAANTSRAIRKNPRPSFSCSDCSSATEVAVSASVFGGSSCWIVSRSCAGSMPSSPSTEMESNTPSLLRTRWAVAVSNSARVAPPRLSASPNPAMPEIVNSSGAMPSNRIVIGEPTVRSYVVAVAASTATSCGPVGCSPSRNTRLALFCDQFVPIVGGPTPPMASPVLGSCICAYPERSPVADATPCTCCTVSSNASGTVSRSSPAPPPGPVADGANACSARTITSEPLAA